MLRGSVVGFLIRDSCLQQRPCGFVAQGGVVTRRVDMGMGSGGNLMVVHCLDERIHGQSFPEALLGPDDHSLASAPRLEPHTCCKPVQVFSSCPTLILGTLSCMVR